MTLDLRKELPYLFGKNDIPILDLLTGARSMTENARIEVISRSLINACHAAGTTGIIFPEDLIVSPKILLYVVDKLRANKIHILWCDEHGVLSTYC